MQAASVKTRGPDHVARVTVQQAESHLASLIDEARRGEDVVITHNGEPAARLAPIAAADRRTRRGTARGLILPLADDFDAPLDDLREYMQRRLTSTRRRSSGLSATILD
jgi:prevent-host-death family protein